MHQMVGSWAMMVMPAAMNSKKSYAASEFLRMASKHRAYWADVEVVLNDDYVGIVHRVKHLSERPFVVSS